MTSGNVEKIKRSVESLQTIYAIVVALAVGEALRLLLQAGGQGVSPDLAKAIDGALIFTFVAFGVTVVPFFHGMNRHLDDVYVFSATPPAPGAILIDLFVFVIEASLLYCLALAIRDVHFFFLALGALYAVDVTWAVVTYLITRSNVLSWAAINIVTAPIVFVAIAVHQPGAPSPAAALMALAILRTVVDYYLNWSFYFPRSGNQ